MRRQTNLWAVIATLLVSAGLAMLTTWVVSIVLLKVGISGFGHMVALMIAMPVAFAAIALLVARKVLLN